MAKFCGKCGSKLDEKTGLCPKCDRPVNHKNGIWKKTLFLFGCLLVICSAVCITLVYQGAIKIPVISSVMSAVGLNKQPQFTGQASADCYTPNEDNIVYDSADKQSGYVNNMVLVTFYNHTSEEEIDKVISRLNGELVGEIPGIHQYQIEVEPSTRQELNSLCTQVMENPNVFFAIVDEVFATDVNSTTPPNDPWKDVFQGLWGVKWDEENPGENNWWIEATKVLSAWEYEETFTPINIGIVDSGFDSKHEDLDITVLNEDVNNAENHGTHVAGIIGATKNNSIGISGIIDSANLYGVDCFATDKQQKKSVAVSGIMDGIVSCLENNCKVINMSLGINFNKFSVSEDGATSAKSSADEKALVAAGYLISFIDNYDDVLIVQSAGNGDWFNRGVDAKTYNGYFSSVDETVIQEAFDLYASESTRFTRPISIQDVMDSFVVVAAVDNQKKNGQWQLTDFSNYGDSITICAPGKNIFSTIAMGGIDGSYGNMKGTSMAAPIVSGIAGMVWSVNPALTAGDVKEILVSTATEPVLPRSKNDDGTYFMVNAKAAVEAALNWEPSDRNEQITTESLTEGYWENSIQSPHVYKFNRDGTVNEYFIEPGRQVTEDNLIFSRTLSYTFNKSQLKITWDNALFSTLEPVTIDDDIKWDNGLRNQLSEIPSGEVFFYETNWQQGSPDDNAMYLVKVKENEDHTSSLLEKIDTDLVLKGLANIGTGDSQVVYTDQLTKEDWQSIASMWLGNAYWAYQDESDEDPTPIREEDFISTDESRAYFAQDALNTPIQLFGGDPEEVLDALCSYSPYDDYEGDQIRIEGDQLVWTLPGRGYAVIRNLELKDITENSDNVQITFGYELEDVGGWISNCEGSATLVESNNSLGYKIESYSRELLTDDAQNSSQNLSSNNSGTIGQLSWSLSEDGILEVSGEGSMVFNSDIVPWENEKEQIRKVILSESVTSIDDGAFSGCTNLETIAIPPAVTYIGEQAFSGCFKLSDVDLPEKLVTIGFMAFSNCSSITAITIPSSVSYLEAGTFQGCSSLKKVELSEGLTMINGIAFGDCVQLTEINIPTSVTCIDWSAFVDCFSLSDIDYAGNESDWDQVQISSSTLTYESGSVELEDASLYRGHKTFTVSYSLWDGPIVYGDGSSSLATYIFKDGSRWKFVGPTIHFES